MGPAMSPRPDEGQWLPSQVRAMDWSQLEARGMELTKDEFWHPEKGGKLSAAIHINGCSASFCSPEGLVVTNHHCGFGAINTLSTLEKNYLEDGFFAADKEAELPAPGVTVFVLNKIEDVTAQVHAAQDAATTDRERWQATRKITAEIIEKAEASEPNVACRVNSYFEGREYQLVYRTKIDDVRLVYAPPRAIGEFGGEVDNWEWPRHTGDFSFFRAYVAPDGSPRPFAKDNVPFKPTHWLKPAANGIDEGDLVIIMGYPGSTQRYRSSRAVAGLQGTVYPQRDSILTQTLEVIEAAGEGDPAFKLRSQSMIKSLANVQKNAKGMVWGLARNAVVQRKLDEEAEFNAWLSEDPARAKQHADLLADILAMDEDEASTQEKDLVLGFVIGRLGGLVPLLSTHLQAVGSALQSDDGMVAKRALTQLGSEVPTARFDSLQTPLLAMILDEIRSLPEDQKIAGSDAISQEGSPEDALAEVLASTKMLDADARTELFSKGLEAIEASEDPLVKLCLGLAKDRGEFRIREEARNGMGLDLGRRWIQAQQDWRGKTFYPDANSSLRVSIASVKGYEPRDGVRYVPHTSVAGVLAKNKSEDPFRVPEALAKAAPSRKDSRFYDADLGDVPVCFLSDGDTTGGNSGSPLINGKGELVGLNFDRVFENVSGDFGWNAARSRNVSVDIRYALWIMESVYPAPHLLQEMGL